MSGVFTAVFNPGISVSNGSDGQAAAAEQGAVDGAGEGSPVGSGDSQTAEASGSSSDSLGADLDLGLAADVTLSNEVQMSWTDDEGNVQTYSQTDELTISVDVDNTLDALLTNDTSYAEGGDYTA